jgi:NAD(P)H-dependent FMN reductase
MVWWSVTGASRQLVDAAAQGARQEAQVETTVVRCDAARPADLLSSAGFLFVTPENLATMAGTMKDFFDRCYYPVLDELNGRPYATIVAAGSDGSGAARQLTRIATGWRLREVAPPLIVITRAQTPAEILAPKLVDATALEQAAELGATLAGGMAIGMW